MADSREYPSRPLCGVGVIVQKGDAVLLIQRGNPPRRGEWGLPGGAVELGETLREAAQREVREECGIEIAIGGVVDAVDVFPCDSVARLAAMKSDIAISGVIGVAIGALIVLAAGWISAYIPRLVQDSIGVALVFSILLLIALAEMPMMLFGLRQMARSGTTPRGLLLGTFLAYVAFASVYAAIFVLATGRAGWGGALAALMPARFASGVLVKRPRFLLADADPPDPSRGPFQATRAAEDQKRKSRG